MSTRHLRLVHSTRQPIAKPVPHGIPAYRGDGTDRCPGCDRRQWHVGRLSAECPFCSTVIPIAEAGSRNPVDVPLDGPIVGSEPVLPLWAIALAAFVLTPFVLNFLWSFL